MSSPSTLRMGSKGVEVARLQQLLLDHGYDPKGVDGVFGRNTDAAVRAFQQAKKLTVDGIVGPQTWAALLDNAAEQPTLRKGSRGAAVELLQTRLNALGYNCGAVDGVFGDKTLAAVKTYQRYNGLAVDGIVGPQTWAAILQGKSDGPKKPQSAHFGWDEVNVHAPSLEAYWKDLPPELYANAQDLMDNYLEPLRAELNRRYGHLGEVKLVVRSWYRPEPYNTKVGGAKGSLHTQGKAADVYATINGKRIPNCYQIARAREDMKLPGGRGCGANINYHIDSGNTRIWWYTYTSWSQWEKNQGAKA